MGGSRNTNLSVTSNCSADDSNLLLRTPVLRRRYHLTSPHGWVSQHKSICHVELLCRRLKSSPSDSCPTKTLSLDLPSWVGLATQIYLSRRTALQTTQIFSFGLLSY